MNNVKVELGFVIQFLFNEKEEELIETKKIFSINFFQSFFVLILIIENFDN